MNAGDLLGLLLEHLPDDADEEARADLEAIQRVLARGSISLLGVARRLDGQERRCTHLRVEGRRTACCALGKRKTDGLGGVTDKIAEVTCGRCMRTPWYRDALPAVVLVHVPEPTAAAIEAAIEQREVIQDRPNTWTSLDAAEWTVN